VQGRARFQLYQKLLALLAAFIQAVGQLTYIRPFVPDWDVTWLAMNTLTLVAGAMVLVHVRSPPGFPRSIYLLPLACSTLLLCLSTCWCHAAITTADEGGNDGESARWQTPSAS
jgi:hypothetical protein